MSLPPAKPVGEVEEKQRKALINLLGDEDPHVYRTVRQKIISYGPDSSQWLRAHTLSNDPALRRRAREIVNYFDRLDADTRLLAFCLNQGEDFDLERGVLLLARTQYPDLNMDAYGALLDDFANTLSERLDLGAAPEQTLQVMNDFLFRELGFAGDEKNYYDPDNSYFNKVLDRRLGNPFSLSILYLLVGRRLKLPIAGIGLPGHFLCRFQNTRAEIYIDAFHAGRLLTRTECIRHVVQLRQRFEESYLAPVSSRRILLRICANLHQIYTQKKEADHIERLQRYLVALAK